MIKTIDEKTAGKYSVKPKFVFVFRVFCRRFGFDDVSIVGESMEQVCKILEERYGNRTTELIGTCRVETGESVTAEFEE